MYLAKPHRIEADSIAEFYLCEDVFISLRLRISRNTWQLVEESETHAFLPNWRDPACPIARQTRRNRRILSWSGSPATVRAVTAPPFFSFGHDQPSSPPNLCESRRRRLSLKGGWRAVAHDAHNQKRRLGRDAVRPGLAEHLRPTIWR